MQGSTFPDGVTVDHVALRRTELTKSQEILRNRTSWTSRGLYQGGQITLNTSAPPPYLNIDVKQVSGFSPNGEFVQTDSDYYNIPLADYTAGVANYVCLVYTEASSVQQPHETNGNKYYTRTDMAWRVRIYTAAQYALLPATDENLANDAQDRIILLGKVTANGAGITLTTSSIEVPREFNNIMYTIPQKCVVVLGTDVIAASSDSPLGAGTLTYDFTPGTPPTYQFTWTTSNGSGAAVPITADGIYVLYDGAGAYIRVRVSLAVLPIFTVATTLTETITIYNLYYQEMPRLTAEDWLHRNFIGTGVISPTNPHGQSLDDITGESFSLLDEHQDVQHCNGIWRGSASSIFQVQLLNNPGNDTFNLIPPTGADLYYINGRKLNDIDVFLGISIPLPLVQSAYFYEICVSDEATVEINQKAAYPGARTVTGTWIVDMSKDYPMGSYTLSVTKSGGNPWVFTWDGGKSVTVPLADPPQVIRLFNAGGERWVDLYVNTMPSATPDETLPSANASDLITVYQSLTDGSNQFMQIAGVLYWWDAVGMKWVLGYPPLLAARYAVDKRIWGTTGTENMATWALEDMTYLPNNELGRSGVLLRRNGAYNEFRYSYGGTGFNFAVNGGSFYCRGQRVSVKTSQTVVLTPNTQFLVWVDTAGVYQTLDINSVIFGGDIQAAMRYVLGFTQNVPSVDSIYHYYDSTDAPERGVLLYYLETDAADVTRIVDFMQNVNQVDDRWSVGSRVSALANSVHAQAAYDTLFTAFEYAKYSMYGTENKGAVTLTVIGSVDVAFKITQPEYVNVRGTRGLSSPAKSIVRVAETDVWGTWLLSYGCKVSNLSVYCTSTTEANGAIALNHYTTVEECFFISLGGGIFRTAQAGMLSCNGVILKGNTSAGGPFTLSVAPVNGHTGWIISGNEVLAVPSGSIGGIELRDCKDIVISDNVVSVPDSNDAVIGGCPGISVATWGAFQSQGITIRDNFISVGNNAPAQTNSVAGIYLNEVWLATVSGNVITRASGSATQIGVGIYFDSLSQCSIVDNKIGLMGGGIYGIGYLYDTEISRNKMQGLFQVAISVVVNSFPVLNSTYGLRVEQNDIYVMAKGLNGGLFTNPDLYGIVVASDLSIANSALSGFSISNNFMSGCGSLGSGAGVYGIILDLETGTGFCKSLRIDDNCVDTIVSGTGALSGISLDVSGATAPEGVSLSRNRVTFTSTTTSADVTGIYVAAVLEGGSIDNNVSILESSDDTADGVALYQGARIPLNTRISGNLLFGMSAGAYILSGGVRSIISDNIIYAKGSGLHLGFSGIYTFVHGNHIQVDGHIDSPWSGVTETDYPGAHCFSLKADSQGVVFHDNVMFLKGANRPGIGVNDVPTGSACAVLVRPHKAFVDGCTLRSNAETVDGTTGVSPNRAFLLYLQAGHVAVNGRKTTCVVSNSVFDDRIDALGATRTPLHALFVQPVPGFDHSDKDSLYMSVKGNTFYTSNFQAAPFGGYQFNLEGRDGTTAPAYAPYTIYVSYSFGDPDPGAGVRSWSHVYFVGNSVYAVADYAGIPYVYLPFYNVLFPPVVGERGSCHYEENSLANFTNWNDCFPAAPLTAWPGP